MKIPDIIDVWKKASIENGPWDNPEGWDGERGESGVQDGEHMYTRGWCMSMYGQNHNIVK